MASQLCILVRSCLGKKKEKGFMKSSTSKVDVLPGTLLLYLGRDQDNPKSHQYVLECTEQDNIEVLCNEEEFQNISQDEYELLITVPTCQDRFTIFQNKEWLNEGLTLKVGDYVEVYDKPSALDLNGVLRFKGGVQGVPGIHFGVELLYNQGQGSSDGMFRNQRYFTCEPESAVFVGLHRIRKSKEPHNRNASSHKNNYDKYGLRVGDRIVWVSDAGPEHGSVKWIGLLPDSRSKEDVTVGVEFDNAVGSGTGKYKDKRLFTAKQGHASLVPIMGLMEEAEFLGIPKVIDDEVAIPEAQGKSEAEVIEEQRRIYEEAQHHKGSGGSSSGGAGIASHIATHGSQPLPIPQLTSHKAGYQSHVVAEVHQPPPAPHRNFSKSKNVNPLYEYNRSKNDYLPDDIGPVVTQESTSSSSVAGGGGSQPNSSRYKNLPSTTPDPELDVGSLVEVMSSRPLYGLIKWIGHLPDQKEPKKLIAGLEMEEEITAGTDGTFGGHRMFTCPPRKGLFVPLYKCRKDKRFCEQGLARSASMDRSLNFGSTETPDLCGTISPPDSLDDITVICGKGRGIQGHHNSCYMDATLLAMFYFTTVFDSILHRPKNKTDLPEYAEVQQVLKEGIVNPLRRHHYVRADKMMKLRKLLDKVGKIPGMMSEEKDPEEFLNLLLSEITKADPFLRICSETNQDVQLTYFYQLIMEKDERLVLPTTQQLFELSFLQMGIKLKEVPSCLIIQMPRFGKDYKMYRRILPSLELDITDVLENVPRECIICGDLAAFECKECYQVHGAGLNTIAFCEGCKKTSHQHKARINHRCRQINVPARFKDTFNMRKVMAGQPVPIPREKMELFAVICIQTSHYVSFVKTGKGNTAKWIFFDSMADRMGEQSGYNIPEVKICDEIPLWLSEGFNSNILNSQDDKELPEHMRRLISDAYICMYQSPNVMMFK